MDRSRRQELYDRIRAASMDEVVLEEMVRHGFWPSGSERPHDPASDIKRRGELQRELAALRTEATRLQDEAALRREAHRRRLEEARKRREETKARAEATRQEKAAAWKARQREDIVFLGEEVSQLLGPGQSDRQRLGRHGLPELSDAKSIAAAMGISIGELRFLAFDRRVAKRHHYRRFLVPKKTGGERLISAPMPRLKAAQRWVLDQVLAKVPIHGAAHGFVEGRSICTNAAPHARAETVVNLDLADFFPSVGWLRVRGLLTALGYAPAAATILALLCTEREVDEIELDGECWFVGRGDRVLPQGSPASPAITNLLCRRLDARLTGLSRKHGATYTRYADDLTFSWAKPGGEVGKLIAAVERIVSDEGFAVHPNKTRVMRKGRRQEVTGLVVNDRPAVPRKELRRFRATLFQIERDGPEGKRWGHGAELFASLRGFAAYVAMVDPDKGRALVARVEALVAKHGYKAQRRTYAPGPRRWEKQPEPVEPVATSEPADSVLPTPDAAEQDGDETAAPKKKWWQFWK